MLRIVKSLAMATGATTDTAKRVAEEKYMAEKDVMSHSKRLNYMSTVPRDAMSSTRALMNEFRTKYFLGGAPTSEDNRAINQYFREFTKASVNCGMRTIVPQLLDSDMLITKFVPDTFYSAALDTFPSNDVKIAFLLRDNVVLPGASPCFTILVDTFLGKAAAPEKQQRFVSLIQNQMTREDKDMFAEANARLLTDTRPLQPDMYTYNIQENTTTRTLADVLPELATAKENMMLEEHVLAILYQVIHAMENAREECGLVHYNLIPQNIHLKPVRNPAVRYSIWAFHLLEEAKKVFNGRFDLDNFMIDGSPTTEKVVRFPPGSDGAQVQRKYPNWALIPASHHRGRLVKIEGFGRSRAIRWWMPSSRDGSEKRRDRYIWNPTLASLGVPSDPESVDYAYDLRLLAWKILNEYEIADTGSQAHDILLNLLYNMLDVPRLVNDIRKHEDVDTRIMDEAALECQLVPRQAVLQYANLVEKDRRNLCFSYCFKHIDGSVNGQNAFREQLASVCELIPRFLRVRDIIIQFDPFDRSYHGELLDYWRQSANEFMEGAFDTHQLYGVVTIMALDVSKCNVDVRQILSAGGTNSASSSLVTASLFPSLSPTARTTAMLDAIHGTCKVCKTMDDTLLRDELCDSAGPIGSICQNVYRGVFLVYDAFNVLYESLFYTPSGHHRVGASTNRNNGVLGPVSESISGAVSAAQCDHCAQPHCNVCSKRCGNIGGKGGRGGGRNVMLHHGSSGARVSRWCGASCDVVSAIGASLEEIGGECGAPVGAAEQIAHGIGADLSGHAECGVVNTDVIVCAVHGSVIHWTTKLELDALTCPMCKVYACCNADELAVAMRCHEIVCPMRWFNDLYIIDKEFMKTVADARLDSTQSMPRVKDVADDDDDDDDESAGLPADVAKAVSTVTETVAKAMETVATAITAAATAPVAPLATAIVEPAVALVTPVVAAASVAAAAALPSDISITVSKPDAPLPSVVVTAAPVLVAPVLAVPVLAAPVLAPAIALATAAAATPAVAETVRTLEALGESVAAGTATLLTPVVAAAQAVVASVVPPEVVSATAEVVQQGVYREYPADYYEDDDDMLILVPL